MVVVAVVVVAFAGFGVYRLHGVFGSHNDTSAAGGIANEIVPFNPKQVILDVFGPPGTVATINYLDVDAQPQRVDDATLPWSYTMTTTLPAVFANVVAQGDSDSIGCRITVNGVVKDERFVQTLNALCLLPGQVVVSEHQRRRPLVAHTIRRLSVPILLFWLATAAITNVAVPQLEEVGKAHNVALSSPDAPSLQATKRVVKVFHEFDSDSAAMIVLEGDKPLGDEAHRFYDSLIGKLSADSKHVQHIQDFGGDPLTAAGSQSTDGRAAYSGELVTAGASTASQLENVSPCD